MGRPSTAPLKLQKALIDLIWSQCYSAVTIDAICAKAEVKKGSFYHFYKSKSELAIAAFEHLWETESRPFLDEAFSASKSPTERFESLLQEDLEVARKLQSEGGSILGCPFCNVAQEVSTLEPEIAQAINDYLNRFRSYLVSSLRDAIAEGQTDIIDPEATAKSIYNLLHGSFAQARIQNSLEPLLALPDSIGRLAGLQLRELKLPQAA